MGLAVVGQRISASNFLLDGLDNNNSIVTGPLQTLVPEAVEEYRISTNNYSAEYGRTSGFVANAITLSPSTRWHAMVYDYQEWDKLDANGWQENASAFPREPLKETEPGVVTGGPILKNRWFISGVFELNRYRTKSDPQTLVVPTTGFSPPSPGPRRRRCLHNTLRRFRIFSRRWLAFLCGRRSPSTAFWSPRDRTIYAEMARTASCSAPLSSG